MPFSNKQLVNSYFEGAFNSIVALASLDIIFPADGVIIKLLESFEQCTHEIIKLDLFIDTMIKNTDFVKWSRVSFKQ